MHIFHKSSIPFLSTVQNALVFTLNKNNWEKSKQLHDDALSCALLQQTKSLWCIHFFPETIAICQKQLLWISEKEFHGSISKTLWNVTWLLQ